MKKLLSFFFFILIAQAAHAQSGIINVGLKGGMGFSQSKSYDFENAQSWHAGIAARVKIPLVGFYVQPELYYSRNGGEFSFEEAATTKDFTQERIDLPVLLGFRIGLKSLAVRLNAGPMMSFVLEDGFSSLPEVNDINSNNLVWGYQAGGGVDIGKFSIDARYEGNINKYVKSINGADVNGRMNQVVLGLGYWF
ncbi:porin family protein [Sediminitomix flava]|uniref:Outer membrane protein with beta-barrel domain n=1 Tax=Sediminitomix flava TaxID=379075 RepID=A0A315ZH66_SEDFL|nr:porin family protein [Sediminitomix flava]PWJ44188.1 outer membrane protein with beta-barrel domain [Sediminitomix flava]